MEWKTSADHAVAELSRPDREEAYSFFSAEHVNVKQRAKETQGSRTTQWCWRSYREQRPHTAVLKASADHAVAEFQRPDRRQSSGSVQHVVVNYATVEHESIYREPTITQQRSAT